MPVRARTNVREFRRADPASPVLQFGYGASRRDRRTVTYSKALVRPG
jgi:hypothetical protein